MLLGLIPDVETADSGLPGDARVRPTRRFTHFEAEANSAAEERQIVSSTGLPGKVGEQHGDRGTKGFRQGV